MADQKVNNQRPDIVIGAFMIRKIGDSLFITKDGVTGTFTESSLESMLKAFFEKYF